MSRAGKLTISHVKLSGASLTFNKQAPNHDAVDGRRTHNNIRETGTTHNTDRYTDANIGTKQISQEI